LVKSVFTVHMLCR